jgi:hypothetical protein
VLCGFRAVVGFEEREELRDEFQSVKGSACCLVEWWLDEREASVEAYSRIMICHLFAAQRRRCNAIE